MDNSYTTRSEAGFLEWGRAAVPKIEAMIESVGLPAVLVGEMRDAYEEYATAFQVSTDPKTATSANRQEKTDTLRVFREAARPVVNLIQANPEVSNQTRKNLGLRVHETGNTPAPYPPQPEASAILTGATSARLWVRDPADPSRRAKPAKMRQVVVHARRGPTMQGSPEEWPVIETSGRTTIDLVWPDLAGDATFWIAVRYVNTANVRGPLSVPVSVRLPGLGTGVEAAEKGEGPSMKIAA